MAILSRFNRWRHGRGFGIHSPYAFVFVTEVLRQKHGFYAYTQLKSRRSRLTLRIVLALKPAAVCLITSDPLLAAAVKAADSSIVMTDDPAKANLIIVDAAQSPEFALEAYPQAHALVFHFLRLKSWRSIVSSLPYGHIYHNARSTAVIARQQHLPAQVFDIKF